jgi:Flp pilus assembly protein TadG
MTRHRAARDDNGSITVITTVFAIALILILGLVVDGGSALAARRRADNLAQQAARAGAQAIDRTRLGSTGVTCLDPQMARAYARAYLAALGITNATVIATTTSVHVVVPVIEHTLIVQAVGIRTVSLTGTGSAVALTGVATATSPAPGSCP